MNATRVKAEGGDGEAMLDLGDWYYHGEKGLAEDFKQAAGWYQRGHDLGHVSCTAQLGLCHARGEGVEYDEAYAVHLYSIAADRGSEIGCYYLARIFAEGWTGLRKNPREATRWFRAMESAKVRDCLSDDERDEAAKWLRKHAVDS